MDINKSISFIKKVDQIYKNSPTARMLTQQAPLILSLFREMRRDMDNHRLEIERICAERYTNLEKFRMVAPVLTSELSLIGQQIRNLQKTVRDKASIIGSDPNAQIQIDYTNKQISDLINMFNALSLNLLMA